MNKNDGGDAFPQPVAIEPSGDILYTVNSGLTLRDYFAGQTLAGLMSDAETLSVFHGKEEKIAPAAYEIADAMIAEREK
mgnify:CR=1 FL=1